MPAYFDTGYAVRTPSWHGQERLLADYPESWDAAREAAGLTWEPRLVEPYVKHDPLACPACAAEPGQQHDLRCPLDGTPGEPPTLHLPAATYEPVPSVRLVQRDDTGAILGHVGAGFGLVSHALMGRLLEALADQPNVRIDTAGSVKGGAQVYAAALLDEPYRVAGDSSETLPYIAVLNAHDGSAACKAVRTQVRVVCANTYNAASMAGERSGLQYVFRHSATAADRVEDVIAEAKEAIDGLRADTAAWQAMAADLYARPVDATGANAFLADFIPEPVGEVVSDRVRANVAQSRARWRSLYEGPTCADHHGTALGLVDAAVEYLDHVRTYRNADTYVGRTLLRPEPLKAKATALALEVAGN